MKTYKSITTFILVTALLASCGSKDKKGMQGTDETPIVQVQSVFAEISQQPDPSHWHDGHNR